MLRWVWRFAAFVGVLGVVASFGASYEVHRGTPGSAAARPPGRLIDVGGHRLHLWCFGQGSPTVVFDSGLGGTALTGTPCCAMSLVSRPPVRTIGQAWDTAMLDRHRAPVDGLLVSWQSWSGAARHSYRSCSLAGPTVACSFEFMRQSTSPRSRGCSSWTPQTRTRRPNSPRRVSHPTYRCGTGLLPLQLRSACCG